ncbi:unnamed protein product [Gongylonema pulchrum]|uniref:DUF4783 domain-containing protein n=1 Tax=Gongylonema pulchrum TaxID=637853 RepID=A0A183EMQ2_9BILA|nr:unnamed protein product [Gongylonema pulchrum]
MSRLVMYFLHCCSGILVLAVLSSAQFTSQTYPDPRVDPFSCKTPTTGPVCDPSELLTFDEKKALAGRINQLFPGKSLDIIVDVIDKIGTVPTAPVDIEKFANNLKSRYQHFQDVSLCDVMVLIVNSKSDRQVFTVAGKDTKLTKEVLKAAFEQNINHFRVIFPQNSKNS